MGLALIDASDMIGCNPSLVRNYYVHAADASSDHLVKHTINGMCCNKTNLQNAITSAEWSCSWNVELLSANG